MNMDYDTHDDSLEYDANTTTNMVAAGVMNPPNVLPQQSSQAGSMTTPHAIHSRARAPDLSGSRGQQPGFYAPCYGFQQPSSAGTPRTMPAPTFGPMYNEPTHFTCGGASDGSGAAPGQPDVSSVSACQVG